MSILPMYPEDKTIYQAMKALGARILNDRSHLYVEVTQATKAVVDRYALKADVSQTTAPDGTLMFEIPHAYDPYWESGGERK